TEAHFGLDWPGRGHLVDGAVQRKCPHFIAVEGGHTTAVAAYGHRDVLRSVDRIGHWRSTDAHAGLELPQLLASLRVVGGHVAVDLAGEQQTASGRGTTQVEFTWIAVLPGDLIRATVERGNGAVDRRANRRDAVHTPV